MKRWFLEMKFRFIVLAVIAFMALFITGVAVWANHDAHVKCARLDAITTLPVRVHFTACQVEIVPGVWVDAP